MDRTISVWGVTSKLGIEFAISNAILAFIVYILNAKGGESLVVSDVFEVDWL